jgi:hypothetical protein
MPRCRAIRFSLSSKALTPYDVFFLRPNEEQPLHGQPKVTHTSSLKPADWWKIPVLPHAGPNMHAIFSSYVLAAGRCPLGNEMIGRNMHACGPEGHEFYAGHDRILDLPRSM